MLPKNNRLQKKKDFAEVIKRGRGAGGEFLVLKSRKRQDTVQKSRIGFVVSKKVSKKAVVRNKVKRRLREAVRLFLPQLKKGYSIVFFAKPAITEQEFGEIKDEVGQLLKRASLLDPSGSI